MVHDFKAKVPTFHVHIKFRFRVLFIVLQLVSVLFKPRKTIENVVLCLYSDFGFGIIRSRLVVLDAP